MTFEQNIARIHEWAQNAGIYEHSTVQAQVHIIEARINGIPRNAIDLVGDGVIQMLKDLIAAGLPAISDASYDEGPAFDEWRFDMEAA